MPNTDALTADRIYRGQLREFMRAGMAFDTVAPDGLPVEYGCIVTEVPDARGQFAALDSDGIECSFDVRMVTNLRHAR